jgi:N-acetylmuramoyl-L-alanine amidase
MKKVIYFLLIAIFFLAIDVSAKPSVKHRPIVMRAKSEIAIEQNYFHLNLQFNRKPTSHVFFLDNPNRLVIDVQGAALLTKFHGHADKIVVTNIRTGTHDNGVLRIVFDLRKKLPYHVAQIGNTIAVAIGTKPASVVKKKSIVIKPKIEKIIPPMVAPVKKVPVIEPKTILPTTPASTPTSPITSATQAAAEKKMTPVSIPEETLPEPSKSSLQKIVVVIDPGHGGKDPGAEGIGKVKEKDVVLAIAQDMAKTINKNSAFHAVLTRDGDYFLTLRERIKIASENHANFFVAIHADAFTKGFNYSPGASVFVLSQRGATSEAARFLAEKENESELGHKIEDKSFSLRSILVDLAQTATISTSLDVGLTVLDELIKVCDLHSSKVEQAGFVVLKSVDIPSMLIETGFISDPEEELKLKDPTYQIKLADALATGIENYFIKRPPQGTILSERQNRNQRASLGDTLNLSGKI